jgi:hypothetical protein
LQRDSAEISAVIVSRRPPPVSLRLIEKDRIRIVSFLEGSGIDKRLEGTAGLHLGRKRPVVRGGPEILAAYHRIEITRLHIHADKRAFYIGASHGCEPGDLLPVHPLVHTFHNISRLEREIAHRENTFPLTHEHGVTTGHPLRDQKVDHFARCQPVDGDVPLLGPDEAVPFPFCKMVGNDVPPLPFVVLLQPPFYRFFRRTLQAAVDGRIYLDGLAGEDTPSVLVFNIPDDRALEIGIRKYPIAFGDPRALLEHRVFPLLVDKPFFPELVDHILLTHSRKAGVFLGCVARRRLHDAGQQGRLAAADPPYVLAEIDLRRRFYTVNAVPHINIVEVKVEDFLLGQVVLQPVRKDRLAHLSQDAPFRPEDK